MANNDRRRSEMDYYEYKKLHDQYYRRATVKREPPKKQEEPEETIDEILPEEQPARGASLLNALRTRIARPQEDVPEEEDVPVEEDAEEETEAVLRPEPLKDEDEYEEEEDDGEGIFSGIAGRFKNLFRGKEARSDEDREEEEKPKEYEIIEKSVEKTPLPYSKLLTEEEPVLSRAERRKLRETGQNAEEEEEETEVLTKGKPPKRAPEEDEEEYEEESDAPSFFGRLKGKLSKHSTDVEDEEEDEEEEDVPSFFSRLKGKLLKHPSEEGEEEDEEEDAPIPPKKRESKPSGHFDDAEDENDEEISPLPEDFKEKLVNHPSVAEYGEIEEEENAPAPIEIPKDALSSEEAAPSPFAEPEEEVPEKETEGEDDSAEKVLPRRVRRALEDETGGEEVPSLFSLLKKRPKAEAPEDDDDGDEEDEASGTPILARFRGLFTKDEGEDGDEEEADEEKYDEEGAPPSLLLSLKQMLPKRDPSEKAPTRQRKRLQYLPPIDEDDDDAPNTKSKALKRLLNTAPAVRRFEEDDDTEDTTAEAETEEKMPPRKMKTEDDEMTEKELRRILGEDTQNTQRISRRERRAAQEKEPAQPEAGHVEEPTKAFMPEPDEPTQEFTPVRPRTPQFSRTASLSSYDDDDDDDIVPVKKPKGFKKSRFEDDEDDDDEKEYGASGDIYDDEDISSYDDYDDEDDEDEDDQYEHDIGFGKRVLRFFKGLLTTILILAILYCSLLLLENAGIISLGFIRNTPLGKFLPAQKAQQAESAEPDTMPQLPEGEQLTPEEEAELHLSEEDGMQGDSNAETTGDATAEDEDIAAP